MDHRVAVIALLLLVIAGQDYGAGSVERVFIPLYIYPNQSWSVVANYTPGVGLVIANPESGPGNVSDRNYAVYIAMLRQRNVTVLGYVPTYYNDGTMPLLDAENEISKYYSWYKIDGIFLDMVPSICNASNTAYYTALYNYIKGKYPGSVVMMDPGTSVESCYGGISDVINIFENNYSVYTKYFGMDNWTRGYTPSHFSMIVYNVPNVTAMQSIIDRAGRSGVGYVFITNRDTNNTLGVLPEYLRAEAEDVNPIALHPRISLANVSDGRSIDVTLGVAGGSGNYTYSWNGLPSQCVPNGSRVACTLTYSNTYNISVKVGDSNGFSQYYGLEVNVSGAGAAKTALTQDPFLTGAAVVILLVLAYYLTRMARAVRRDGDSGGAHEVGQEHT
jgi:hypothetical protein